MASALPLLLVGGAALLLMGRKKKNGGAKEPSATAETEPPKTCGKEDVVYVETYKGIPLYRWDLYDRFIPIRAHIGVCEIPGFRFREIVFGEAGGVSIKNPEQMMQKARYLIDNDPDRIREMAGLS